MSGRFQSGRSKGQSLIIQFIIFFIIGLTLFLGVGTFFRYESDIFKDDASRESLKMINSYFSSIALTAYSTCKQCDNVNITVKTANTTAGSFFEVSIGTFGLNASIPFTSLKYVTSIHNLNSSLNNINEVSLNGAVASAKPITLTFNKTQNKITIS